MQTAIVSRALDGFGPALTLTLAGLRWRLVLGDSRPRPLEAYAAGLATATDVVAIAGDLADDDYREQLVAAAGPCVDLVVNNALEPRDDAPPTVGYRLDDLEDAYRETVLAPVALLRAVLPRLSDGASVINVIPGGAHGDVRAAASAALDQLTEAIAIANPQLHVRAVHADAGNPATAALDEIASTAKQL
jgi:NAD(P)-dependent dehydrogenase (short-subunit alcohol dehydrogenase family)